MKHAEIVGSAPIGYAPTRKRTLSRRRKVVYGLLAAMGIGVPTLLNETVQNRIGVSSLQLGAYGLPTWNARFSSYTSGSGSHSVQVVGLEASIFQRSANLYAIYTDDLIQGTTIRLGNSQYRHSIGAGGFAEMECTGQRTTEIKLK